MPRDRRWYSDRSFQQQFNRFSFIFLYLGSFHLQTSIGYNNILCCTGRIISYTLLDLRSSTTTSISEFEFSEIIHRDGTPRCPTARDASSVFDPGSSFSKRKKLKKEKSVIDDAWLILRLRADRGSTAVPHATRSTNHPRESLSLALGKVRRASGRLSILK